MTRFLPLTALLLVAALAAPGSAGAVIQIDRGIGGARIGNTKAEVQAALGKPSRTASGRNPFGVFVRYGYRREGITVLFQGGDRVSSVATTGRGDRTTGGVGVGSTERSVDARVRGVKCETIGGTRSCHTGEFTPGRRITDFFIRRGRVTRVTVGIVID